MTDSFEVASPSVVVVGETVAGKSKDKQLGGCVQLVVTRKVDRSWLTYGGMEELGDAGCRGGKYTVVADRSGV